MVYSAKPLWTVVVGGPWRRRGYIVVREDGSKFRRYLSKDWGGIEAAKKLAEAEAERLSDTLPKAHP